MATLLTKQAAPAATTLTTLHTVTSATVVSSIVVCNRGNTDTFFRLAHRIAGASIATSQYLNYDTPISANDSISLTIGITANTTDVISIYAGNANLTFTLYGEAQ